MENIDTENQLFYETSKPEKSTRTRERLLQISELGLKIVGYAQFGIPNIMSGLYIERVWSMAELEWTEYVDWIKELKDNE